MLLSGIYMYSSCMITSTVHQHVSKEMQCLQLIFHNACWVTLSNMQIPTNTVQSQCLCVVYQQVSRGLLAGVSSYPVYPCGLNNRHPALLHMEQHMKENYPVSSHPVYLCGLNNKLPALLHMGQHMKENYPDFCQPCSQARPKYSWTMTAFSNRNPGP